MVVVSAKAAAEGAAMEAGRRLQATPFDPDALSARAKAALRWHQNPGRHRSHQPVAVNLR